MVFVASIVLAVGLLDSLFALGAPSWEQVSAPFESWSTSQGHFPIVKRADENFLALGVCSDPSLECPQNKIWIGEQEGATWTDLGITPGWSAREDAGAVRVGSNILLLGGYALDQGLRDVWASNDEGMTWTQQTSAAMWPPREAFSLVASGNYILLLGGFTNLEGHRNDVWVSSNVGVTWSLAIENAPWVERGDFGTAVLSDQSVFLMGGLVVSDFGNDVWVSEGPSDGSKWLLKLNAAGFSPRHDFGCVALSDDSIVVVGGQDATGTLNDVWRGTQGALEWELLASSSPWEARRLGNDVLVDNSNQLFVIGGTLYGGSTWSQKHDVWRSNAIVATTTTTTSGVSTSSTTTTTSSTTTSSSTSTATTTSTTTTFFYRELRAGQLFKHFRFMPMTTRVSDADAIHLSEVYFSSGDILVSMENAVAINPRRLALESGTTYESASNAIDGSLLTKWHDNAKGNLIISFGYPVHADHFAFATADDRPDMDPCLWRIEGSNDFVVWDILRYQSSCATPLARSSQTPWFHLRQTITNNGFELGSVTPAHECNINVPHWQTQGEICYLRSEAEWVYKGSSLCKVASREGDYFIGLRGEHSAVSQIVPRHIPGKSYILKFLVANCHDDYDVAPSILRVMIDGGQGLQFTPPSTAFTIQTVSYQSVTEDVGITFMNGGPTADTMIFIDQVLIVEASPASSTSSTSTTTSITSAVADGLPMINVPSSSNSTDFWWMVAGAGCGLVLLGLLSGLMFCVMKKALSGHRSLAEVEKAMQKVQPFDDIARARAQ
jgi:hypothetical protein